MSLKLGARLKKAGSVVHNAGVLALVIALLQKLQKEIGRKKGKGYLKTVFLVKHKDVLAVDWVNHPYVPEKSSRKQAYTINWVMSPPRNGGGHQNIYRFIKYLEDSGHTCRVYLYSVRDVATISELREGMKASYPDTKATMEWLDSNDKMRPADAVFATGWETAYPVFKDASGAQKFYFVQDFEPYFYPVGSEYVLAENTYKFNFYGITAGGWLTHKLQTDYGMRCDSYDFSADKSLYKFTNEGQRKKIFFYARPVTARRGFELGILALELFHKQKPDYEIVLAGWDVAEYDLPFPYTNLKTMALRDLSAIYNDCAAALVLSFTNMSLLPLELLACGTIPVVNDAENNRLVSDNPHIVYVAPSPAAIAEALVVATSRKDVLAHAKSASESITAGGWDEAGRKFIKILEGQLSG